MGSLSFLQEIFPTQGSNPQVSLIAGRFFTSGATREAQYPCMSWKFTNGQYDGQRQTSSNTIRTFYDRYLMSKGVELEHCDLLWQDIMVIPVSMGIQLTCYADKDADLQRMFEQVMRKTKDSVFFLYVKEFWFMNIRRDIKVKLTGFNFDYGPDDMGEDAKREVKVTFDFMCEAFIYREIEKSDSLWGKEGLLERESALGQSCFT